MTGFARALRKLVRFGRNRAGIAMTEFALLLPAMVLLYVGTVALTETVIAKRKLNLAISTVADLASQAQQVQQVQTLTSSDIASLFGAGKAIMGSLADTSLKMRITSVIVYPGGTSCVDWSAASNMTALKTGTTYAIPATVKASATTAIRNFLIAEGSMTYIPPVAGLIPGTTRFAEGPTYVVPRQTDRVLVDTSVQNPAAPCV